MKKMINVLLFLLVLLAFAGFSAGDLDNCGCGQCENIVLNENQIIASNINQIFHMDAYGQTDKTAVLPVLIDYPPKQTA